MTGAWPQRAALVTLSLGFLARDMEAVIPASQGLLYTLSDNAFEACFFFFLKNIQMLSLSLP